MNRRDFITLLGGATAWPLAARAQQGDRARRIGVLMAGDRNDSDGKTYVSAFTQALADLGWTDGRNARIRSASALPHRGSIRTLAQELVGQQPDIILASGAAATAAVQRETRTIPIVFVNVVDPVASGLVARLNRPGGNITGFGGLEASLGGKWLELLSEIAPGLKRAAIMFSQVSTYMPSFETAARSLKVAPIIVPVHSDVEIETAIIALGRETRGGLVACKMLWLMHPCSSDWPIKAMTFRRASSRRLKRSPRNKRPISKNGGRFSRPRISRENKSGSRLALLALALPETCRSRTSVN